MKKLLRKIVPESVILQYHRWLAKYAARKFGHPSKQMIIIGVTGTKGKSTTSNIIWHLLTRFGFKVGLATTVNFRIGDKHWLNNTKMTMLGRTQLQEMLADMVDAGCHYAVVETSSEGIKQSRHIAIHYDIAVFTNLYPEHLDAHGGMENYKNAKLELFKHLSQLPRKQLNGESVRKAAVINADAEYAQEFAAESKVDTKITWSQSTADNAPDATLEVRDVAGTPDGVQFSIGDYEFKSALHGTWNVENIVSAMGVAIAQGMSYPQIQQALTSFTGVPGRMEMINQGQPFKVVVDYAYEPVSLGLLYQYWREQVGDDHNVLTLISSTGGGRDVWRRPENGKVAASICNYAIATNEDPYDEDPQVIIDEVAAGCIAGGMVEGQNFWRVLDRQAAIDKLVALAKPGDVVILTAKGAEQKMCVAKGEKVPWDDRAAVRTALAGIGYEVN